jgi:hypothetical protein
MTPRQVALELFKSWAMDTIVQAMVIAKADPQYIPSYDEVGAEFNRILEKCQGNRAENVVMNFPDKKALYEAVLTWCLVHIDSPNVA